MPPYVIFALYGQKAQNILLIESSDQSPYNDAKVISVAKDKRILLQFLIPDGLSMHLQSCGIYVIKRQEEIVVYNLQLL